MKSPSITFLQAVAISLGAMIGWGAFVLPSDLFLQKSSLLGTMVAFVLGTLMVQLIAQAYIRLAKTQPTQSTAILWIDCHLGKTHATLYGIGILLGYIAIISLNVSALALLMRYFLPVSWQMGYLYQVGGWSMYASEFVVMWLVLASFVLINRHHLITGAKSQLTISLLLVVAIVILTLLSFAYNRTALPSFDHEWSAVQDFSWWSIVAVVPWAYVGFESTAHLSTHIKNAQYHTKSIVSLSIVSGFVLYLLVTYLTAVNFAFDYHSLRQDPWATGNGIKEHLGNFGTLILSLAMLMAIISGINGFLLSATSLICAMQTQQLLPSIAKKQVALYGVFGLCSLLLFLGRPYLLGLVRLASLMIAIGFVYVVIADLVALRQRHEPVGIMDKLRLLMACAFVLLSLLS